jgi:hypothetical protein
MVLQGQHPGNGSSANPITGAAAVSKAIARMSFPTDFIEVSFSLKTRLDSEFVISFIACTASIPGTDHRPNQLPGQLPSAAQKQERFVELGSFELSPKGFRVFCPVRLVYETPAVSGVIFLFPLFAHRVLPLASR